MTERGWTIEQERQEASLWIASWPIYQEKRPYYEIPREFHREGIELNTPVHMAYRRASFRQEESKVIVKDALEGRLKIKTERRYQVIPKATFSSLGVTLKLMF